MLQCNADWNEAGAMLARTCWDFAAHECHLKSLTCTTICRRKSPSKGLSLLNMGSELHIQPLNPAPSAPDGDVGGLLVLPIPPKLSDAAQMATNQLLQLLGVMHGRHEVQKALGITSLSNHSNSMAMQSAPPAIPNPMLFQPLPLLNSFSGGSGTYSSGMGLRAPPPAIKLESLPGGT